MEDYQFAYKKLPFSTAFRKEGINSASAWMLNGVIADDHKFCNIPKPIFELGRYTLLIIDLSLQLFQKESSPVIKTLASAFECMISPFGDNIDGAAWFFSHLFYSALEQKFLRTTLVIDAVEKRNAPPLYSSPENEEAESQSVSSYSNQITAYIEIVTDLLDIADQIAEISSFSFEKPHQKKQGENIYDFCMDIVSSDINRYDSSKPSSLETISMPLPRKYKRVAQSMLAQDDPLLYIVLDCFEVILSEWMRKSHENELMQALSRVQRYIKIRKDSKISTNGTPISTVSVLEEIGKHQTNLLSSMEKNEKQSTAQSNLRKRKLFDFHVVQGIHSHSESLLNCLIERKRILEKNEIYAGIDTDGEINESFRDKNRLIFRRSFMRGIQMLNIPESDESVSFCAIAAWDLEHALFDAFASDGHLNCTLEYKAKARSLKFNLEDLKNPTLCARVFSGEITYNALVKMSVEEMSSKEAKELRQQAIAKKLKDIVIVDTASVNDKVSKAQVKKDINSTANFQEKKSTTTDTLSNKAPPRKLGLSEILEKASAAIASTDHYLQLQPEKGSESPIRNETLAYDPDTVTGSPSFSDDGSSDINDDKEVPSRHLVTIQRQMSGGQVNKNVIAKNGSHVFRITDGLTRNGPSFKCSLVYDSFFQNENEINHNMPDTLVVSNRLHVDEFNKFVQRKTIDPNNGWKVHPVRISFTGVARYGV